MQKIDFDKCNKEIEFPPEQIQNFGYLLGLKKPDFEIASASNNIHELFTFHPADILIKNISMVIQDKDFLDFLYEKDYTEAKHLIINRKEYIVNIIESNEYLLLIIEVSHFGELEYLELLNKNIKTFLNELTTKKTLNDVLDYAVNRYYAITKYDHVMIYQFEKDKSGRVVAEVSNEENCKDRFIKLRFPAAEIPAKARNLYLSNTIRMISDIDAESVEITSTKEFIENANLNQCILRTTTSHQKEYTKNMGTKATLVLSIIVNNKLWGLVIQRNLTPKYTFPEIRKICTLYAQILQLAIQSKSELKEIHSDLERSKLLLLLKDIFQNSNLIDIPEKLFERKEVILNIFKANFCSLRLNGEDYFFASPVNEFEYKNLLNWISVNHSGDIFCTHNLHGVYSNASDEFYRNYAGILSIPLNENGQDRFTWVRVEETLSIEWGGKPEYTAEENGGPSPRKSFERWQEMVYFHSEVWTSTDIDLAEKCLSLKEILLRKQSEEKIKLLNEELKNLNYAKDKFFSIIAHDLRGPFTSLLGFSESELRLIDIRPKDKIKESLFFINQSSRELLGLIDSLLEWSSIQNGKVSPMYTSQNLQNLINELHYESSPGASRKDIQLTFDVPDNIQIHTDIKILKKVLKILIHNSIKFSNRGSKVLITTSINKDKIYFTIEDEGIGIPTHTLDKLFRIDIQYKTYGTENEGGSGLGLIIAKDLLAMINGKIELYPKETGLKVVVVI